MNIARGLRRLWVVVTVSWLMYCAWSYQAHCQIARPQYSHDWFFECSGGDRHYYSAIELCFWVFLVPVLLFIMGLVALWVGGWVVRGFGMAGDTQSAPKPDLNIESG
jgi:hypothetical protein